MSVSRVTRSVGLIVLGVGNVTKAFVQQIKKTRSLHESLYNISFQFLSFSDSTGYACLPSHSSFFNDQQVDEIIAWKNSGNQLANHQFGKKGSAKEAVECQVGHNTGTIVVDCSATESTVDALITALQHGIGVALANKKPLTSTYASYMSLTAPSHLHLLRYESSVGAGTPFIAVTRRVINSGDNINKIVGTFSGTLGFLMTALANGSSYSSAVHEAMRLGYTEPDPRDDLSGLDVARKALILARMLGWKLEMKDVQVTPLFPSSLADLSIPQFIEALPTLDEEYKLKHEQAKSEGCVLKYVATIENGQLIVGLKALPSDSPLGRLQGSDNMLELHTEIYTKPLVVQGSGAGGTVTAAGVLADCVELAPLVATPNKLQHVV